MKDNFASKQLFNVKEQQSGLPCASLFRVYMSIYMPKKIARGRARRTESAVTKRLEQKRRRKIA
jgi:hypothetical protein